ncbi:MAG: zinc ribbon domain-containing protein [Pseudomonadota bacterium]
MPIFEFKCTKCDNEFERLVFNSESGEVACPQCGASETRKLLSVFASSGPGRDIAGSCSSHSGGHS